MLRGVWLYAPHDGGALGGAPDHGIITCVERLPWRLTWERSVKPPLFPMFICSKCVREVLSLSLLTYDSAFAETGRKRETQKRTPGAGVIRKHKTPCTLSCRHYTYEAVLSEVRLLHGVSIL